MNAAAPWTIRPLRHADLPLFRPLRLEALRTHPEQFGSSFEEEQDDDMARMIGDPPNLTLGGFAGGALVGTTAMIVSPKLKQRHKGHVVGVYVTASSRRTGLAGAMLERLISEARNSGLILLTLSVTLGNKPARTLYLNAGFVTYGVEPLSLRIGSNALDSELMALKLV